MLTDYVSTKGSCFEGAIAAKSPALTRLLLDAGAHINFSRPRKDFDDGDLGFGGALSAAISNPQEGLLTELIKRGADVNFGGGSYYGQSEWSPHHEPPFIMSWQ